MGRVATIGELALLLMKIDDRKKTTYAESGNLAATIAVNNASPATVDPTTTTLVEWALVPKLVSPMQGSVALANNIRLHFSKINLQIGGTTVVGPYTDLHDNGRVSTGRDAVFGGIMGTEALTESQPDSHYPTGVVAVPGTTLSLGLPGGHTMTISGTVELQLFAPDTGDTSGTPLQTFEFDFTTGASASTITVPIPGLYTVTPTDALGNPLKNPDNSNIVNWIGGMRSAPSTYAVVGSSATFTWPSDPKTKNGTRQNGTLYNFFGGGDVLRSVVPTAPSVAGDIRLVALTQNNLINGTLNPFPATTYSLANARAFGVAVPPTQASYATQPGACSLRAGLLFQGPGWSQGALGAVPFSSYNKNFAPEIPVLWDSVNSKEITAPFPGDWDNGTGLMPDGPWANKPDEGLQPLDSGSTETPYVGDYQAYSQRGSQSPTLFSPNRQVSSPVMFGSLPAGTSQPWRTLLFRPANLLSATLHPGGSDATIRDHLLLDMFWMPVVEPYGISEPFATSGKVNLNTQIVPFTYVTRTTGLRAVLKSVMVTALDPNQKVDAGGTKMISAYKAPALSSKQGNPRENPLAVTRYPIDLDATLNQLTLAPESPVVNAYPEFSRATHTAATPNFFVSASQICDVPLITPTLAAQINPPGSRVTTALVQGFWTTNSLTGNNSLERPYSLIYPRVTTKSNIFTVHVHAQALKKNAGDINQARWQEGKDQVLSDYRGSYTIEKYFDPNANDISDLNGATLDASKDDALPPEAALRGAKWRLLNVKRFGQ